LGSTARPRDAGEHHQKSFWRLVGIAALLNLSEHHR
jgi:hypothetical protein